MRVAGGAWTAKPLPWARGLYILRWYVDFPEGVERNDVSIPAGRVFFSGACFDSTRIDADAATGNVVDGPGGVDLYADAQL